MEDYYAEKALYSLISAANIVGLTEIDSGELREGRALPACLIQQVASTDYTCNDSSSAGVSVQYQAEIWADGESYPTVMAAAMHDAINGKQIVIDDYRISMIRLRTLSLPDQYQGHECRRRGGVYKIFVTHI